MGIDIGKLVAALLKWVSLADLHPALTDGLICHQGVDFGLNVYLPVAAASVGLMVFMYMIGKFLQNKRVELYLKVELYEIFSFAFVLAVIFPFLLAINCIDVGSFFGVFRGVSIYKMGQRFWEVLAINLGVAGYYVQILSLQLASVLTINVHSGSLRSGGLVGVWMMLDAVLSTMMTSLVMALATAHAMSLLYTMTTYGFLKYLLPFGVLLRGFPPFRKIGGTLVGLSVGMALFFPILSTMFFITVNNGFPVKYDPSSDGVTATPVITEFSKALQPTLTNSPSSISSQVTKDVEGAMEDYYARDDAFKLRNSDFFYAPTAETGSMGKPNLILMLAITVPGIGGVGSGLLSGLIEGLHEAVRVLSGGSSRLQRIVDRYILPIVHFSAIFVALGGTALFMGVFMPPLFVAIGSVAVMMPVLITAIKLFTAMFGEPLDVSNITRLV